MNKKGSEKKEAGVKEPGVRVRGGGRTKEGPRRDMTRGKSQGATAGGDLVVG